MAYAGSASRHDKGLAHSACWARAGPPPSGGTRAQTTLERWQQVHGLLGKGAGLLECARRLQLSLNTVKRCARAAQPGRLQRAPNTGPPSPALTATICESAARRSPRASRATAARDQGTRLPGSMNLLVRYINQCRVEADRPHLSPRRAARILLTRPTALTAGQSTLAGDLAAACPEMTALASLISSFAALLTPDPGQRYRPAALDCRGARCGPALPARLRQWPGPGHPGGYRRRHVALSQRPNRGSEHYTKMIKRQKYGRASVTLLRHRILLS